MEQSTFCEVRSYKSLVSFRNRIYHNNRAKNHGFYKYARDEYLNIVELVDPNSYKKIQEDKNQIKQKVSGKNKLNNKIQSYKTRLRKYEKELDEFELKFNETNDPKIKKKLDKKQKSIRKIQTTIDELEQEYEALEDFKSSRGKGVNYNELVFEITNIPSVFCRDKKYGEDLLNMVKEYINNLEINMDIHSFSLHMDQHGKPHVHVLGSYQNGSLNKDLANKFNGKPFNYYDLQVDFNNFVSKHNITKKYNFQIQKIVKGGKKDYIGLNRYKEILEQSKQQAKQYIINLKKQFKTSGLLKQKLDLDGYLEAMEKKFYNLLVEKKMDQNLVKKLKYELETQTTKKYEEVSDLELNIKKLQQKIQEYEHREEKLTQDIYNKFKNKFNGDLNKLNNAINNLHADNMTLQSQNDELLVYKNFVIENNLTNDFEDYKFNNNLTL